MHHQRTSKHELNFTYILRKLLERRPVLQDARPPYPAGGLVDGHVRHVHQVPLEQVPQDHQAFIEPLRKEDLRDGVDKNEAMTALSATASTEQQREQQ